MSEKYKFTYKTIDDVRLAAGRLGVDIPLSTDTSVLARPVNLTSRVTLKNSLAIHPMEGFDGNTDGSPSELTKRRYDRFARGGAGLIWFEATSVCPEGRSSSHQLWIHENNVDEYARLVDDIHKKSDGAAVIAQLTHSGRFSKPENKPAPIIAYHNPLFNKNFDIPADYPVVTDDYLDSLREKYVNAAILAKKAGFDGVDIKSCHRYLMSELLSAYQRDGRY
ncbi:MAG TPA: flavin oxidoreductase/NADH oxidase, partial [Bacillota bacterium]|nr:flavin oxidoreductase/NADH oxidase [Bacillota bacterium]